MGSQGGLRPGEEEEGERGISLFFFISIVTGGEEGGRGYTNIVWDV